MKIFWVNGEIMESFPRDEIFLALWQNQEGYWNISGVIYHNRDEIETNLFNFHPLKILVVKIKVPEEAE